MAKLHFKTGTMGSGKSLDLLRAIFNYEERGMEVLVFKTAMDTREGTDKCLIKSRTGLEVEGRWIHSSDNLYDLISLILANRVFMAKDKYIKAIFVDEAQFLTEKQVDELQRLCYNYNIPIMCYGLKLDFQSHLFAGSKRLIELADEVQELIGICHCGRRAKQNARISIEDNRMLRDGEVVQIGGNESYIALCNKCYLEGRIK